MTDFFSRLSYSFGNEDPKTEHKALKIKPGDRVLCITASGDRPLHLLLDDPEEVVSIDINAVQNYLLDLKTSSMKHLTFQEYAQFLGLSECKSRAVTFEKVSQHMDKSASEYWRRNFDQIERGVLFEGAMEKFSLNVSRVLKTFRRGKVKELSKIQSLDEQKQFLKSKWNTISWRKSFEWLINPYLARWVLRDPGMYAFLGKGIHPGKYLYHRMNNSLNNFTIRENPLLSYLWLGKVFEEGHPPYLTEQGIEKIKPRLNRLKTVTKDLISYIEQAPANSFDAFSCSDVASYISQKDFDRLIRAICYAAKPGARFSIRQFMSDHQFPSECVSLFQRDHKLEQELQDEDKCFVYRFMAGTINK